MIRTIEQVENELIQLDKQIQATFYSNMGAQDKRILLEGYAIRKDSLQQEKKRFSEVDENAIRDIEVRDAIEVSSSQRCRAVPQSKNHIEEPKNQSPC